MILGQSRTRGTMAEKFVEARRKEEATVNNISSYLKSDQVARHIASWEDKGGNITRDRFTKQKIAQLRANYEQQTELRRSRLKNLYDYEEAAYENEMRRLRPSYTDIKEEMMSKVERLKQEREATKQEEVAEKYARRFKEQADELRKVDADIKEIKTKQERDVQMLEKQQLLEKEYMEDMIYAELWRRDMEKKYEVERRKELAAKSKNDARNQILQKQYLDLMSRKHTEKEREELEKQMLNERWQSELERLREQEALDKITTKRINGQIFQENLEYRKMKEVELENERKNDKEMINEVVNREQMLAKLEADAKEQYKIETKNFLSNFKNRSDELKVNQDLLDRLLKEETDRQWAKRQAQWDKEEEARVKLLYNVYGDRANVIERRKQESLEEKAAKERERQLLHEEVARYENEEKRKELEEILRMKQHQNTILWQVNEKEELKRRQLLQEMEYERTKRLKELEYEMMIEKEKEKGRILLEKNKARKLY